MAGNRRRGWVVRMGKVSALRSKCKRGGLGAGNGRRGWVVRMGKARALRSVGKGVG